MEWTGALRTLRSRAIKQLPTPFALVGNLPLLAQRLHGRSLMMGRALAILTLVLTLVWFGLALLSQPPADSR